MKLSTQYINRQRNKYNNVYAYMYVYMCVCIMAYISYQHVVFALAIGTEQVSVSFAHRALASFAAASFCRGDVVFGMLCVDCFFTSRLRIFRRGLVFLDNEQHVRVTDRTVRLVRNLQSLGQHL